MECFRCGLKQPDRNSSCVRCSTVLQNPTITEWGSDVLDSEATRVDRYGWISLGIGSLPALLFLLFFPLQLYKADKLVYQLGL